MLIFPIIRFFLRLINKEDSIKISTAHQKANTYEYKLQQMENITRMTKEDIIDRLGTPTKIKQRNEGSESLMWKGRKYCIEIEVDASGKFHHKTESYT